MTETPTKTRPKAAAPTLAARTDDEDVVDLAVRILEQRAAAAGIELDSETARRQLREQFGGMAHYVRSGRPSREDRAREVADLLTRGGKSVTQVSRELGISRASAYRLRRIA